MNQRPYFQKELGDFVDTARGYGIGKTIGQIAAENPDKVSLSTLKAITAGRHIRPEQLKVVHQLYAMRPLDWIETKILYIEHYMEEYLVPPAEETVGVRMSGQLVERFFNLRRERLRETSAANLQQYRLSAGINDAFDRAGRTALEICASTGPSKSKKDKSRMSYPTITAIKRGEHIRPAKLQAIGRALNLPRLTLRTLKIAYAEAYLSEFLLGDDPGVFARVGNAVDYPRTMSLLIYSTENAQELA